MRVFGAVPTTQRLHETDDLTSLLEASLGKPSVNGMRKERIGSYEDVSARNENTNRFACKSPKEASELVVIF